MPCGFRSERSHAMGMRSNLCLRHRACRDGSVARVASQLGLAGILLGGRWELCGHCRQEAYQAPYFGEECVESHGLALDPFARELREIIHCVRALVTLVACMHSE